MEDFLARRAIPISRSLEVQKKINGGSTQNMEKKQYTQVKPEMMDSVTISDTCFFEDQVSNPRKILLSVDLQDVHHAGRLTLKMCEANLFK